MVRESDMLGFNQKVLRGAFMARADRVHNGKRQTRNQPFLSIYQLESRKSIRLRKNRDTLEGTGGKSVFSQLSHRLLNQMYL